MCQACVELGKNFWCLVACESHNSENVLKLVITSSILHFYDSEAKSCVAFCELILTYVIVNELSSSGQSIKFFINLFISINIVQINHNVMSNLSNKAMVVIENSIEEKNCFSY